MTPPSKPLLWTRKFVLLSMANLFMFTAFYFLIPILPVYIVEEIGGSKSITGLILAFYTLAALIVRPFTGVTIDSLGRKMIFLISMIAFTVLFNAYIIATTVGLLLLLRFIHGLTWGVTTTSGITVVVDIIPPARRGEGISIYGLSFTLAMALGPLLGTWILGDHHYERVFIAGFALSLIGWFLALSVKYPEYVPLNGKKITLKKLFEPRTFPVSFNLLIVNITYGGVISFIALYAKEIGIENIGMFFLLYAIGVTLTRTVAGRIFDRKGPFWIVSVGIALVVLGFLMIALWKSHEGFYGASVLMGLGGGVIMPTFQAMVNNLIEPHRRGAANSTLFTALDLGIGIGMVGVGLVSEWIGLSHSWLICSIIALVGLVFFISFAYPHYQKVHPAKD